MATALVYENPKPKTNFESSPVTSQEKQIEPEASDVVRVSSIETRASNTETRASSENQKSCSKRGVSGRVAIPAYVRKKVFKRDQSCQYQDLKTGKICASLHQLEIDHKIPVWAKGNNEEGNLQLLCISHNRYKFAKQTHRVP